MTYPPDWRGDFYGHGSLNQSGLTTAQREEIARRYAEGETASALALEFGVKVSHIRTFVPPRYPR